MNFICAKKIFLVFHLFLFFSISVHIYIASGLTQWSTTGLGADTVYQASILNTKKIYTMTIEIPVMVHRSKPHF